MKTLEVLLKSASCVCIPMISPVNSFYSYSRILFILFILSNTSRELIQRF